MATDNIDIVKTLVAGLLNKHPEIIDQDVVIFGSSAVALNDVDLGRRVDDLDLFVSEKTYEHLRQFADEKIEKAPGVDALKFKDLNVEVLIEFPGVKFDKVRESATEKPQTCGLLVAALDDLAAWKAAQIQVNPRDKDYKDLEKIRQVLSSRRSPG